jgi:hypothetical protein
VKNWKWKTISALLCQREAKGTIICVLSTLPGVNMHKQQDQRRPNCDSIMAIENKDTRSMLWSNYRAMLLRRANFGRIWIGDWTTAEPWRFMTTREESFKRTESQLSGVAIPCAYHGAITRAILQDLSSLTFGNIHDLPCTTCTTCAILHYLAEPCASVR